MKNVTITTELLVKLEACADAREAFAAGVPSGSMSLRRLLPKVDRADWLLWLLGKTEAIDRPTLVLCACACARTALKYVPAGEGRPLEAICAAEKWARNPTEKNRDAAYAASAAASSAASAAAFAASAAASSAASAAAFAASDAAFAAAYAVDAAASDAASAADRARVHFALCRKIQRIVEAKP